MANNCDIANKTDNLVLTGGHGLGDDLNPGGEDSEDDEDADKLDIRAAMRPEQLQGMIKQGRARRLSGKSAGSGAADAADDSEAESGNDSNAEPRDEWFDVASETQKIKRLFQQSINKMRTRMNSQYDAMRSQLDVSRNATSNATDLVETKIARNRAEALLIIKDRVQDAWQGYCKTLAKAAESQPLGL